MPTVAGRHRATEAPRTVLVAVLVRAALIATAAAVSAACFFGWDWHQTHDRPLEHTVVVSVDPAGGTGHCGKGNYPDNQTVTRHSSDPPRNLPADFTDVEACDVPSVGDHQTLVRVPRDDADPKVYVDPPRSLAEVVGLTALATALVLVVGIAILSGVELWRSWRRRRTRRST